MTPIQIRRLGRWLVKAELCSNGITPGTVSGSLAWDVLGWIIALNDIDPRVAEWHDRITEDQKSLFQREWIGGCCQ